VVMHGLLRHHKSSDGRRTGTTHIQTRALPPSDASKKTRDSSLLRSAQAPACVRAAF
jgi:hypothetical protein